MTVTTVTSVILLAVLGISSMTVLLTIGVTVSVRRPNTIVIAQTPDLAIVVTI